MPQTSLEGPALRALAAGAGRTPFSVPGSEERGRDRIWELSETLHCSIVGTCLTTPEARALLAKLNVPDARTMSEHHLHGRVVHLAGRREGGGKLLQKMLDRRHAAEIRRFDAASGSEAVRALWRAALERGEIPGAYWAALTHPATDWALVQDIFDEVHMLSHLVGRSNRADLRRLRQLEADLAEREETVAAQGARIRRLTEERDGLRADGRAAQQHAAPAVPPAEREPFEGVQARLARERSHAEALTAKLAALMQAAERLAADLEAETVRRRDAEAECAALEAALEAAHHASEAPRGADDAAGALAGRTLLYVGGRPRQVASLRRFVAARGGRLLDHDGGVEHSLNLLPGLVGRADLVLFPVPCVSHEAVAMLKRACGAGAKPYRALRSAGLASLVHALVDAA